MATIRELQKRARKLTPTKVRRDVFNLIKALEEELAAYNRATLHEDSQDVDGKPIGFYSYGTELITKGRKAKGQPFDLLESGEFLDNIFARVEKGSIFFDTSDKKKKEVLANLWSENILGLQDQDLNKVIDTRIIPIFQNYYKKELFR